MTEAQVLVEVPEAVAGSWHDAIPTIAAGALERLRLGPTDQDAAAVAGRAPAACASIDQHLELRPLEGRVTYAIGGVVVVSYAAGTAPADVLDAAVTLTAELYQRRLATFGTVDVAGEAVRLSADHLRGVASMLAPYVEGFAVA